IICLASTGISHKEGNPESTPITLAEPTLTPASANTDRINSTYPGGCGISRAKPGQCAAAVMKSVSSAITGWRHMHAAAASIGKAAQVTARPCFHSLLLTPLPPLIWTVAAGDGKLRG